MRVQGKEHEAFWRETGHLFERPTAPPTRSIAEALRGMLGEEAQAQMEIRYVLYSWKNRRVEGRVAPLVRRPAFVVFREGLHLKPSGGGKVEEVVGRSILVIDSRTGEQLLNQSYGNPAKALPPKADAPEEAKEARDRWGEAVEGLQCRLRSDKAVWSVGEVPTFRLDVRNHGKRDLVIHMAQDVCKVQFDGRWFNWSAPVSIPAGTWPAGRRYDDFEVRVSLDRWWQRDGQPIALRPGRHTVRVAYVTLDRKQPVRAVSNAVEIRIVRKDKKGK